MERAKHRNRKRLFLKWILALALVAASCESTDDEPSEENKDDGGLRLKPDERSRWSVEEVAEGDVGLYTKLALLDEKPVVAYHTFQSRTGDPCTETGNPNAPPKMFWDLYYSYKSQDSWQQELVTPLLVAKATPLGLDLKVAPDGTVAIASLTGEPIGTPTLQYCGAHDVGYFQRDDSGQWQVQTAVRLSNEAAVTGDTAAASNHGEVVGFWPALAFDQSGNAAIAYRDGHTGTLQHDDLLRADLELAIESGGGWRAVPVDWGRSAGAYNRLIFDQENRFVVLYFVSEEDRSSPQQGLWVARSADDGASWQKVRLFAKPVPLQPDIAVDPSNGNLYVVYFNADFRTIYIATLIDDSAFESASEGWEFASFGDNQYEEGRYSSIAVDPDGRVAVAYYRCNRKNETEGDCSPWNNGLVFAWREVGSEGSWTVELVDQGDGSGECGTYASLAFSSDGAAYIAYLCQHLVDDKLESRVHLAKRDPL